MSKNSLIIFYSGRHESDVQSKERIIESFKKENISIKEFDISKKYSLYGHTFSFENSFVLDYSENGKAVNLSTPLLRVGKELIMGEESIKSKIPYLKEKYSL